MSSFQSGFYCVLVTLYGHGEEGVLVRFISKTYRKCLFMLACELNGFLQFVFTANP